MTEQLELGFHADSAEDAQRQAREWCRAEPRLRLVTIASVRLLDAPTGLWRVTVAVRNVEPKMVPA